MDDKDYIIEFEDLFKEDRKKRELIKLEPERKNSYISAIMVYFLTMFALSGLIYIFISGIESFQTTYADYEAAVETLVFDENGLLLLPTHLSYDDSYVKEIAIYQNHYVLVNINNTAYDFLFDEAEIFLTAQFESILSHQITVWDNDQDIIFYKYASQSFPFLVMIPIPEDQIITSYTTLSTFGLNIVNFSTYVILLPWVYFILKKDLIYDYKRSKLFQTQTLTLVITGYLFVIFGNLISNALSNGLAFLLDYEVREAVNQVTIIRALNAPGMPLMLISAVILGPIVEELIFRKAFFGLFKNVKLALIISSFTFGAIHLIGEASFLDAIINGLSYIVMGFVFGFIYIKNDKNIWIPIIVHILSNLIAILAILFLPI